MKKRICTMLIAAAILSCAFPLTAFAVNETSDSTEIILTVPERETTPTYSYIVYIPESFTLTGGDDSMYITATEMDIPADKEVVVRLDAEKTMEDDGNFYLYLNGDKTSEHFIQCYIFRISPTGSGMASISSSVELASFKNGEYSPYDWERVIFSYVNDQYLQAEPGTYSGKVYYTIGLE